MDPGLRTPLVEAFRRPDVPLEVRLDAAEGKVAPRAHEQLALLMILVDDEVTTVREVAERTIASLPPDRVAGIIALPDTPAEMVRYFGNRGIAPAAGVAVDESAPLVDNDAAGEWAAISDESDGDAEPTGNPELSITQRVQQMNIVQRVRAAMKGSREIRALLVRDPNKMVASAVLSSPKLTLGEVEAFAKMATVSEDVLRTIGQTRAWSKSYAVVHALARNPKTPVAMSMNLLQRITDRDVRAISIDRNVPEPLRVAARKRVTTSQQK